MTMIANPVDASEIPYAVIPCDPGAKQPPARFISGRHYEDFEPGHDYRASPDQPSSHVASKRCNLVCIDVDDAAGFKGTRLGALLPELENIETYSSAVDVLKTHVYVIPPAGAEWPVKWATHEWPYDLLTRNHVRAEPAYMPTGNAPLQPDAGTWARILAAITEDQAAYAQRYRTATGGTPSGSTAGDWTDDAYQITGDSQLTADIASMVSAGLDDTGVFGRLDVILTPLGDPWTHEQIQGKINSARAKGYDSGYQTNEALAALAARGPAGTAGGRAEHPMRPVPVDAPQGVPKRRRRTTAADTPIERVKWLWEPYVPADMITVMGGMEGTGKTQIAFELAARVTKDGAVVIISPEDPRSQVTIPRLIAAGADLTRCHFFDAEADDTEITLTTDLRELGEFVKDTEARLVIIDPIVSVLDSDTDGDSYKDVSRELASLAAWAQRQEVTVLAITHLRKASDGVALNKMMGSKAFTTKPRSVLMTAPHPEDPGQMLLAHAKCNVGPKGVTWGYRIEGTPVDPVTRSRQTRMGAEVIETSRVVYLTELEMFTADSLMSATPAPKVPRIVQCAEFVREYLESHGGIARVPEVKAAALRAGFGKDNLTDGALKTLAGIRHDHRAGDKDGQHWWALASPVADTTGLAGQLDEAS